MANVILRAKGVKKGYKSGSETFWALGGISLDIEPEKLTILKGRSGSGKTTLINILGALDHPTEGSVFFDGKDITRLSERARDQFRKNKVGFVFQSIALVGFMTAYENVEFGLRIAGYSRKDMKARAEECLALVGLKERMKHMAQELSGGEQQRVAIARALAHRPSMIFADEPTGELDTNTGFAVIRVFKDLIQSEGITVIMTTHDPGLMEIADSLYQLEDGKLLETSNL